MAKSWQNLFEEVLEHYGPEHQKDKLIEEMGELQTALIQERQGRKADVITEIADVYIVLLQLCVLYGPAAVDEEINRKLNRLVRRMDNDE